MAKEISIANKLVTKVYDSVAVTYPSTSVTVYSFKNGNRVVTTITVTYTDSNQTDLLSVVKS